MTGLLRSGRSMTGLFHGDAAVVPIIGVSRSSRNMPCMRPEESRLRPSRGVRDHAARRLRRPPPAAACAGCRRRRRRPGGLGVARRARSDRAAGQAVAAAGRPQHGRRRAGDGQADAVQDVTTYNNFYEFGTDKADPARYAHTLKTSALDGGHRGRGEEARHAGPRHAAEAGADGGAHLPPALRRGLVDGDALGRLFAGRADQASSPPATPSSCSS
jgi:hypothetical protein